MGLLYGLGMALASALLGCACGLIRGEGNQILLAIYFGAAGAFVGLLGYGSIAGIFGGLARLLGYRRPERGQQKSERSSRDLDEGAEE
jgi:hypothetical protein